MDSKRRKALETAGWRVGEAADFLGLSDEERKHVALRLAVSDAIRVRRAALGMTQQQLATRLQSSQSRVAKIEAGLPDVSLDLMFRSLFALGGDLCDLDVVPKRPSRARGRS
jgi:ribosome-binding protein aMBF1 (putative translation factor)